MDYFDSPTFAARVEHLMKQRHVPGFAIAITRANEVKSAAYGHASLDPPIPFTTDTLVDIASCSKSFTAVAVGLLVDDKNYPQVKFDAVVSRLLPEDFVLPNETYTNQVTVDDILSHRTGMPRHDLSYVGPRAEHPDTPRSVTRNLRNLPLVAPLRTKYIYNNMMFTAAVHLIQVTTQQSFADFLQERFFRPLGMDSTSLQPFRARARGFGERIAMGYTWKKDTKTYNAFTNPDAPEADGAGCIVSSVDDLIKWVQALMNHQDPITDSVYRGLVRMRTIIHPNGGRNRPYASPIVYAAGVEIYYYRGYQVVKHGGSNPGFQSRFFFLPELNFGAAMFGNSNGAYDVAAILSRELIDEALGIPQDERKYKREKQPKKGREPNIADADASDSDSDTEDEGDDPPEPRLKDLERQPLATPQTAYTGTYENRGYHTMTVEIKNDKLFIDTSTRSFGFTVTFEHISGQTKFAAHVSFCLEPGDWQMEAEFAFEGDRVVRMGLNLESDMKELVWFDRVSERST
ncbi:beta-lactamase/transpeptidase-like protein [Favolaschia claudopus]|uniref:Beta-lactamase/transpeptidase-like protein n=1 Tax=Favolaschia claudopus TaxID=2862362 RepID=A0AAW0E3Q2_9AGAR